MATTFEIPKQLRFGHHALTTCVEQFLMYGRKVLIICDPTMVTLGYTAILTDLLQSIGLDYSLFQNITHEPCVDDIVLAASQYHNQQCDMLIGIGGGSVLDAMKAISIQVSTTQDILEFVKYPFEGKRPPMIAIPTTAGTGSEATQFTIITDPISHKKCLLKGKALLPDMAILDSQFISDTPYSVRATCGIDALCHAIEAYLSVKTHSMSQMYAIEAIRTLSEHLPISLSNPNVISDQACLLASYQAGCAFSNSSVTLLHGLSRPIGAHFNIPHGLSNALLLPTCMHFYEEHCTKELAQLARDLHWTNSIDDHVAASMCTKHITHMISSITLPKLSTLIPEAEWTHQKCLIMANDALQSGSPANTPCEVNIEMMLSIYNTVYYK